MMKLHRLLPLAATAMALFTVSAHADDRDRHRDRHEHRDRYRSRPGIQFGFSVPYRSYYGPSSPAIIVERPAYYTERRVDVDRSDSIGVDVQRSLARRGYYRGPIDGDIGPGSRAAIRDFQEDQGLRPTGYIDRSLLEALRLQ
ncbi:MAG: peptidoglycan-binding domain-containing protein [Verrucomicrobiota bacterium]